ncbi:hypothetical protein OPTIMUS_115 [Mycobacterium phage Optimus]|uniref:Uncharacterized protein n=3 Tax=Omegavirus TaxID=1623292 RepID=A0A3S9UB03_9CAUD|nr:hypothetical protein VC71_gp122 [Mycobacterium phage Minerva]YP_009590971.1 hypothetical protein FDG54_gp115 [Mycobacterium phage Optimus]YP_009636295.1 hypothetical protein FGG20_gp124 [Mycobacterium phage Baka]AXQ62526.1 hypothetical protein SEA_ZELINK_119 [Mycobacterium phage Zelink]AZS07458.1 hypothetical protein PBI_DUKE13_119 [Mycobacterium phage Duke13]QBI97568.1 hypothetical protein SEA_HUGHESYANG_124 [Mycobacterium phage Hughesyang]AEJ92171.1 hypothetical protein OPTIMUS_115 [Myco
MMKHKQTALKHWSGEVMVDEGIATLIEKLWGRGVVTEFSCQGCGDNPAYIMFTDLEEAVEFVTESVEATQMYEFDLAVYPPVNHDYPRGRVTFPADYVEILEGVW